MRCDACSLPGHERRRRPMSTCATQPCLNAAHSASCALRKGTAKTGPLGGATGLSRWALEPRVHSWMLPPRESRQWLGRSRSPWLPMRCTRAQARDTGGHISKAGSPYGAMVAPTNAPDVFVALHGPRRPPAGRSSCPSALKEAARAKGLSTVLFTRTHGTPLQASGWRSPRPC